MSRVRTAAVGVALAAALAGCGTAAQRASAPTRDTATAAASPVFATPTPAAPATTPAPRPTPATTQQVARAVTRTSAYRWSSRRVTAAELGKSWHSGCPVGPASLRAVTLTFWGFDHRPHTGTLVINAAVVRQVADAFGRIYAARFPIRRMVPIAAYGGDDNASMAADNTSAFNCRYAVANGPKQWSMHAYGEAVDLNAVENPYTLDGRVYPPNGKPYTDRSRARPGMIFGSGALVRAFSAVGWGWGGRWPSSPDYQHFSANGK